MEIQKLSVLFTIFLWFCDAKISVKINDAFLVVETQRVNGNNYKTATVLSLDFLPNSNKKLTVTGITNFKKVRTISVNENSLSRIPVLGNIPKISNIYLKHNFLSSVHHFDFVNIKPRVINLCYNGIRTIEDKSFPKSLEAVSLCCNQLITISSEWFKAPGTLNAMDVSFNKVHAIRRNLFNRFTSLVNLNLAANKIMSIDEGSFTFKKMTVLNLKSNLISELNPNIFLRPSVYIDHLDIRNNKCNYLGSNLFKKIYGFNFKNVFRYVKNKVTHTARTISITGNPWTCPCLKDIEWLITDYKVVQRESNESKALPQCIEPRFYPKYCVEEVDPELYNSYSMSYVQEEPSCYKKLIEITQNETKNEDVKTSSVIRCRTRSQTKSRNCMQEQN